MIIGELALALFVFSICNYINYFDGLNASMFDYDQLIRQIAGTGNSSILLPIFMITGVSEPLILDYESAFSNMSGDQIAVLATSLTIFAALAILGIVAMIIEKDPSGEFAGKPETDNPYQFIIFHFGAFAIGLAVSSFFYSSIIAVMVIEVIVAVLYFVFLGVLRRNFKPNLKNLIPLISVSAFNIIFALVTSLLANQ